MEKYWNRRLVIYRDFVKKTNSIQVKSSTYDLDDTLDPLACVMREKSIDLERNNDCHIQDISETTRPNMS